MVKLFKKNLNHLRFVKFIDIHKLPQVLRVKKEKVCKECIFHKCDYIKILTLKNNKSSKL